MGLLSDAITKAYFADGKWELALTNQGQEITVKGYRRGRPEWSVVGSRGDTQTVFKFDQYAKFDELVIYRNGDVVDREPFGGQVSLPPGAEWVHDVTVQLSEA